MEDVADQPNNADVRQTAAKIIENDAERTLELVATGRIVEARASADVALRRASVLGDGRSLATALIATGAAREYDNEYAHACLDYRAALRHAEDSGDQVLEARASARLGGVLVWLGLLSRAIPRLSWAVHVARTATDLESEVRAYIGLTRVYYRLDVLDRAEAFARHAVALAETRDDPYLVMIALRAMGLAYSGSCHQEDPRGDGTADRALDCYRRAWRLATDLGDRAGELWLVNNIAEIYRKLGRPADVIAFTEENVDFSAEMPPVLRGLLRGRIGVAKLRLGDTEESLALLLEALEALREATDREHLPYVHHDLAEVYEKRGEIAKALEHHKAYHAAIQAQRGDHTLGDALEVAVQLEKDALVAEAERRRRENDSLNLELRDLRERTDGLDHPARRDALTGLPNRMAFDEWLARECRPTVPLTSVALIDVDRFKAVNDRYSHQVGDQVLREVGRLLAASVRQGDLVARYGGEEFGLVLPGTSLQDAVAVCERARERVRTADWSAIAEGLTITLSAGVARNSSSDRALVIADERLYAAKRGGRDRVVAEDVDRVGGVAAAG